jgi:mannose-6-phosphate isomerase class I
VFCLRGTVDLASSTGETLTLHDVESAFVTQGESGLTLGGLGEVYVVSAPTAYVIDA